ncbi:MAG: AAA family ATPase [Pseudomonadota bacterium]
MYLKHFHLTEAPFSLTPDTDFFFAAASHNEALNTLLAAVAMGEGFIKVTAEVGLGKTLLCRLLLRELKDDVVTAYVPDPLLSPRSLRVALADELSVAVENGASDEQRLRDIQARLMAIAAEGKRTVLLIDEAHRLTADTLESVRLLTNLETEKTKLLQVVIVGQPELDRRLQGPELRQLRQRITFDCTLRPLGADDTAVYVSHRMALAAAGEPPRFSDRAIARVYRASRGIPRLVNLLCHKALLAAYGSGAAAVSDRHVRRAIADSRAAVSQPRTTFAPWQLLTRALRPAPVATGRTS